MIKYTILFSMISVSLFSKSVTLMNYNVENLFDTIHDSGKTDYTYLPYKIKKNSPKIQSYCKSLSKKSWRKSCLYTDWTPKILNKKLNNIAKVLKSYKGGADIIVLQEVENENVLRMLVAKLGRDYKYYSLLEGPDRRGIDNGVISKYPIVSSKLHRVDMKPLLRRPTRDILEVNIEINNKAVRLYANHWPSQGGGSITSKARERVAQELVKISKSSRADLTIALGDFNTLKKDRPHGIKKHILKYFYDAHVEAVAAGNMMMEGSHWFAGHWSRLDRLFILKKSSVKIDYRGFNIHSKTFMFTDIDWENYETGEITTYRDVPYRFNNKSGAGFSDHLPLVLEFDI